jgi:hypothetical protein
MFDTLCVNIDLARLDVVIRQIELVCDAIRNSTP